MSKRCTGRPLQVTGSSSVILTAVALQDHWSRSLSLGPVFGPKKVGLGPAARAKQHREVKSLIDTGRHKDKSQNKKQEEEEYVLDPKPPPMTLAQKYGLVYAPQPLLSEQDWAHVKARSNQRDDSKEPCVICKEDFGVHEQVLLSCTHVFHRACLQSLERFTGRKTCPMCRHQEYQTRVIHEGAHVYKHKCATRIQSLWRGYVVRCWYRQLRETVAPKDPKLRKKFYEEKLSAIVDRMVKSLDVNITEFIQEIDSSVQRSREIFNQWDAVHTSISIDQWYSIQLKAVERGETECPICLTELWLPTSCCNGKLATPDLPTCIKRTQNPSQRKPDNCKPTEQLTNQTTGHCTISPQKGINPGFEDQQMRVTDGTICNSSNSATSKSDDKEQKTCLRSTVLLSCTHVFHSTCLATLEDIAMQDIKNTCPVCRAHYQKKVLDF
ncbi:unnamed protein product [Candidula unifasciata]|uniref:RING-type domain-containing protein n=1 Tax=Candidula unifasciata TaxID=100452 RepID=A0A8S3YU22_9EUPU|nr:unnamed protein product [Candidula unifasciata]